ncbi:MAG: DNA mismatch repair protein MutS [Puniceicoccales bacterium]|nr:DNA mismatch repair protein MutS [Puniceicoccales bacterium]
MANEPKITPLMRQYYEYRHKLPADVLLLFRVGDFYEMFDRDAEVGARVLGITLTTRAGSPLAGVPYHAIGSYLPRLLSAGHRAAICEQTETPRPGHIVRRALSRIYTPGTTLEDAHMDARRNNYLLALTGDARRGLLHAAWLELSTAEFRIASAPAATLLPVLHAIDPREILTPGGPDDPGGAPWQKIPGVAALLDSVPPAHLPAWKFDPESSAREIASALGVLNLQGFGIEAGHPALGPAGAVLAYATESLCEKPRNLRRISEYKPAGSLVIDHASQRNLELLKSSGGTRAGSLLETLDATVTAGGARLLEQWLAAPPCSAPLATLRQDRVGDFVRHAGTAGRVRDALRHVRDITRILSRLQNRVRNPRELEAIRETLRQLPLIRDEVLATGGSAADLAAGIETCQPLCEFLDSSLADELPNDINLGGVIREGRDARLDHLRALATESKTWVSDFERAEQERTGIKSLRVRYNGAFGYMIEITKNNTHLAPDNYIRRQTVANAERYTTEELKKKEQEILRADELSLVHEKELFQELVERVQQDSDALQRTAAILAELDIYCGWAESAREWDYCRPVVDDSDILGIEQGRHPVVERMLRSRENTAFVPNDALLQASGEQIALLTGPNMAGKSTYIRQVALIALMAQLGSWVPARAAHVGVIDRLFCRVGASDELAKGNSTFMVEMNETANILNNATPRSLVILDEIGRGTSTYDGISIAWAVAEYLHGPGASGPRTLFATHYHELTRLKATLPRLRNHCVAVKEWNGEIIFVRQVIPGSADRSYGIHVARLAGLPDAVVRRANEILADMEGGTSHFMSLPAHFPPASNPKASGSAAMPETDAPPMPDAPDTAMPPFPASPSAEAGSPPRDDGNPPFAQTPEALPAPGDAPCAHVPPLRARPLPLADDQLELFQ